MGFTGTQEKCNACGKTVYVTEMLTADGVPYHKTCFKCTKCHGILGMGKYSSMDGVLYCKPHFEQLFKETGRYTSNKSSSSEKASAPPTKTPSRLSALFSGTLDKCVKCKKTVYLLEKVTVEGEIYHKNCFRCNHGGCALSPSSYAALDGILYCKPHFAQLFKEKGSYNHLTQTHSVQKTPEPEVPDPEPESPATETEPAEPVDKEDSDDEN